MVQQRLISYKKSYIIFQLIIILFLANVSFAKETIQGKVVSVPDGNTITVFQDSKQYKIRL